MADPDEIYELMEPGPAYTAPEVGRMVGETANSVRGTLDDLADEGRIEKKENTPRVHTYRIPTESESESECDPDATTTTSDSNESESDTLSAPSD